MARLVPLLLLSLAALGNSSIVPTQVFLNAGKDSGTAYNVSWATEELPRGACGVQYGESASILGQTKIAPAAVRYNFSAYWSGKYESPFLHYATLTGLKPATTYHYQVGQVNGWQTDITSPIYSFTTPPPAGKKTIFSIVGDLGQTADSAKTVAAMAADADSSLVLHAGDMSYADTNQSRWDSYGEMIEPLARTRGWMVSAGNHEIESDNRTGNNFVPYQARYNMPAIAPPIQQPVKSQINCRHPLDYNTNQIDCTPSILTTNIYDYGNSFYSFSAGLAHVIALNPYTSTHAGSAQYQWLEAELEAVKTKAEDEQQQPPPWVIVITHCPFYNSNSHHMNENQTVAMKASMEPLFLKYDVPLVFAGHVHAYERSLPQGADAAARKTGTTYVVIGDGGNHEGHATPFEQPVPSWSAHRDDKSFGHGRLTLHNYTHLHFQWFANPTTAYLKRASAGATTAEARAAALKAAAAAGQAGDETWIVRQVAPAPPVPTPTPQPTTSPEPTPPPTQPDNIDGDDTMDPGLIVLVVALGCGAVLLALLAVRWRRRASALKKPLLAIGIDRMDDFSGSMNHIN